MTDRARELLERALTYLVKANQAWSIDFEDEIRAYLAEPEVPAEKNRRAEKNK